VRTLELPAQERRATLPGPGCPCRLRLRVDAQYDFGSEHILTKELLQTRISEAWSVDTTSSNASVCRSK
jgi:hypothetical protein